MAEEEKKPAEESKPDKAPEGDADAEKKKDEPDLGGSAGIPDHEVTHNDEHTADTNVKKVTGSQRRLWVLVVIAFILLSFGGVMFYLQLEDGNIGVGSGSGTTVQDSGDDNDEEAQDNQLHTYAVSGSNLQRYNFVDSSSSDSELGGSPVSSSTSPAVQVSRNGRLTATLTSSGIIVNSGEEESQTILAGNSSSIREWVLLPDGTRIFALIGTSLHSYQTSNAEGGEVVESFVPSGAQLGRLSYTRDGAITMYSKSGTELIGSRYNLLSGEVDAIERTVSRLEGISSFNSQSLSPDGTWLVFIQDVNGSQTLQLLSLNSLVLRTVYLAESGNTPAAFAWSTDSNNVVVYESGSNSLLANLKVGTLEKEIIVDGIGSASSLAWAPNKKYVSYVSGSTLKAVEIESKESTDLIQSLSAGALTGWYVD